ncbi:MAG: GNAT family N-acetyltransferase [Bacteroidetes bacterium]|nr:GNAT family N-acetyltransferase [Bacteroidota bacterium]
MQIKISIRKGVLSDLPDILRLIKELASYERSAGEVEITLPELEKDCFGKNSIADFFVAVAGKTIIGMALFYTKYSTWKGRCIFLDDIIVSEKYRGRGAGKKLFDAVIRTVKERKARRLEWQVLDWNKPAIDFYRKYNAQFLPEWITCRLTGNQIKIIHEKSI